jgi:urocanate hydratase
MVREKNRSDRITGSSTVEVLLPHRKKQCKIEVMRSLTGHCWCALNCAAGADSVQIHNDAASIRLSTHAVWWLSAMNKETDERIKRVFTTDPGMGVARHADAGYLEAIDQVRKSDISIPMIKK